MANRTDPLARAVHGTNPQHLIENIVRQKIYEQMFWKEECFALTEDMLVEKAADIRCIGGTYGGQRRATNFLCLVLKLLQMQPDKDIVYELVTNEDFKYIRVLGAFYLRLVGTAKEIHEYLSPLYHDFRKIRVVNADGSYSATHVDEIVQDLLTKEHLFDTALPHLPYRHVLEAAGRLKPRESVLKKEFDAQMAKAQAEAEAEAAKVAAAKDSPGRDKHASSSGAGTREESKSRSRDQGPEGQSRHAYHRRRSDRRSRSRSRSHSPGHYTRERKKHRSGRSRSRSGSRSRSRERHRHRHRHGERHSRGYDDDRGRDGHRDRGKAKPQRESGEVDEDLAIKEANALRAKLGLKPLKT